MPRVDELGLSSTGSILCTVEPPGLHIPQALLAGPSALSPPTGAGPNVEVPPLGSPIEGTPEIGRPPEVEVEVEEVLLPGRNVLLSQVIVRRFAVERERVGQLVHNADPHFALGLADQHGGRN